MTLVLQHNVFALIGNYRLKTGLYKVPVSSEVTSIANIIHHSVHTPLNPKEIHFSMQDQIWDILKELYYEGHA